MVFVIIISAYPFYIGLVILLLILFVYKRLMSRVVLSATPGFLHMASWPWRLQDPLAPEVL